jgi:hypothetical protein
LLFEPVPLFELPFLLFEAWFEFMSSVADPLPSLLATRNCAAEPADVADAVELDETGTFFCVVLSRCS